MGYGLMAASATLALALTSELSVWICWLLGVNVTVLIAFSFDKSAAIKNRWRVPEAVLFTLSAAGGSPATWVARPIFNHKTTKEGFARKLAIITGIQLVIALLIGYYLHSLA